VVLQHLEGAAWTFVGIQRWNSWADYAKDKSRALRKWYAISRAAGSNCAS